MPYIIYSVYIVYKVYIFAAGRLMVAALQD